MSNFYSAIKIGQIIGQIFIWIYRNNIRCYIKHYIS